MGNDLKSAKYQGKVLIGNKELPCAVLEDGTRILTNSRFPRSGERRMRHVATESYCRKAAPRLQAPA